MKATELRLGNWVKWGNENIQIWGLDNYNETDEMINNTFTNRFKPIPLTEECLLKFGFEKRRKLSGMLVFSKSGFDLHFVNGKWEFYVMGSSCILAKIEYVHQLQNIYLDLPEEELIIK